MTAPISTTLGDYLRARRELLHPAEVGLPDGERRRVPGLRREEVAVLAGISPEYYLRLEQDRGQHPSTQVLDSIADALQLDRDGRDYLHGLANPVPAARRKPPRTAKVSASIQNLMDSWTTTPAYVHGPTLEILASNRMAIALSPWLAPGMNTLRAAFLEPEIKTFYRDWDAMTARLVPYIRATLGGQVDDPRVISLIGELSLGSERFRTLWARHETTRSTSGLTLLHHPQVGDLDLVYEKLELPGSEQLLITYHALPGSESEQKLQLLASLA